MSKSELLAKLQEQVDNRIVELERILVEQLTTRNKPIVLNNFINKPKFKTKFK